MLMNAILLKKASRDFKDKYGETEFPFETYNTLGYHFLLDERFLDMLLERYESNTKI